MKLVNSELAIQIELSENYMQYLTIENPSVFAKAVQDIWNQSNGRDGNFLLSEGGKELSFAKNCFFISNPFDVNCNERKIITKLYQELNENALDLYITQKSELNMQIQQFLYAVLNTVPYHLTSNESIEIPELLKAFDVKIYSEAEELLEIIIDYLRAMKRICGYRVAIFLNIKQYLDEKQLKSLYEICSYEKIYFLNIEGAKSVSYDNEKYVIIDKDLCIIDVGN